MKYLHHKSEAPKDLPDFETEDAERAFWATHDSTEYVNWDAADAVMSFWDGETCEYCHGAIVEACVTLHRKRSGGYVLIENVPAGVCQECGAHYYTANVLKTIEAGQLERQPIAREILVPVYAPYPL